MTQDEAVKQWREGAERNLDAARDMVKASHRDWALFIGQLSLEKLLKGLIVKKKNETPPFSMILSGSLNWRASKPTKGNESNWQKLPVSMLPLDMTTSKVSCITRRHRH